MLGLDILWDRSIEKVECCNRNWNPLEWDEKAKVWAEDGNVITCPNYTDADLEEAEVLEHFMAGGVMEVRLDLD